MKLNKAVSYTGERYPVDDCWVLALQLQICWPILRVDLVIGSCTGIDLPGRQVDDVVESRFRIPAHHIWSSHAVEQGQDHEDFVVKAMDQLAIFEGFLVTHAQGNINPSGRSNFLHFAFQ